MGSLDRLLQSGGAPVLAASAAFLSERGEALAGELAGDGSALSPMEWGMLRTLWLALLAVVQLCRHAAEAEGAGSPRLHLNIKASSPGSIASPPQKCRVPHPTERLPAWVSAPAERRHPPPRPPLPQAAATRRMMSDASCLLVHLWRLIPGADCDVHAALHLLSTLFAALVEGEALMEHEGAFAELAFRELDSTLLRLGSGSLAGACARGWGCLWGVGERAPRAALQQQRPGRAACAVGAGQAARALDLTPAPALPGRRGPQSKGLPCGGRA